MRKISSTRMELLAHQAQIKLAEQGRDLLERKRAALMEEIFRLVDVVMEEANMLEQAATEARQALARANATAGTEAVKSAALASRDEFPLQIRSANVMGLQVPAIEQRRAARSLLGRGYSIVGTSITIDEAASAFETEVDMIIQLAETELRLRRLAEEIQRTSRRLNALQHVLIPRLKTERNYIEMTLDERERSDHFRLKVAKRLLERKRVTK